ncbi:MAG TPA: hypothetical protein VIL92_12400 [Gaiellaceae bacterium]
MRRLTSQIAPLPLGTIFEDVVRVSSWPPTTNGMPVLSVDDYPDTLLAQYIGVSESHEGELHSLAVSLARLADKAVREYRAASEYLSAFVETPGVESIEGHTFLLRAIDHVENCVDAVARAEGFLRTSTFAAMATPDQLETLKTVHEGVRAMRHSIQHADERIVKKQRVPEGEPLFPAITNDGIYFAGDHLFHGELAGTVIHERGAVASNSGTGAHLNAGEPS